jgi:hypothetical protein
MLADGEKQVSRARVVQLDQGRRPLARCDIGSASSALAASISARACVRLELAAVLEM